MEEFLEETPFLQKFLKKKKWTVRQIFESLDRADACTRRVDVLNNRLSKRQNVEKTKVASFFADMIAIFGGYTSSEKMQNS